jgi:hypothetical protein
MGISDLIRKRSAAEDDARWERARPSLERNGFHSQASGLGVAHLETGHTVLTPYDHQRGEWKLIALHGSNAVHEKGAIAYLGPGDEDAGERAMSAMRHPGFLHAMRDQMNPATDNDGTWPRRFDFT